MKVPSGFASTTLVSVVSASTRTFDPDRFASATAKASGVVCDAARGSGAFPAGVEGVTNASPPATKAAAPSPAAQRENEDPEPRRNPITS